MSKDKIKEILHHKRLDKTLLWNSFLLTTGGTIGLFFKALSDRHDIILFIVDSIFVVIGLFTIVIILKLIREINKEMQKLLSDFDKIKE